MGIKGIFRELGPGRRVSLSKLAADSFETCDRPFRIAIDVAIWQFQAQAAQGGTNPAIRTLFYRLVRLLGTPVQPVFVFDGPKKPAFKRNKRSGRGDVMATAQAKRLIWLFGFAMHDAPGEAEAECALLQTHGIVDAVLSEDVDTIMFGCTKTLRNWSAESKSSKTPTHVSLYDTHDQSIASLGLGRQGMVLVALMSGGDYLPDGIPGCGIKVACEAAKAGFGTSICRLKASDEAGIKAWKDSLVHELKTNENGHFRTKHKALVVPDDFPNLEVLRYYTHPVVSPLSSLDSVRQKLQVKQDMHLDALREFARETFGWDFRIGAVKFIRVLGQALLVHDLCQQRDGRHVKRISSRRQHFSTDAMPELRMAFIPSEVVPINLSKEVEENISSGRDGLALNSDVEFEAPADGGEEPDAAAGKVFDVTKPDLAWVLEGVARRTIPQLVKQWEEAKSAKAAPKPPAKTKAGSKRAVGNKAKLDQDQKVLDQFFRTAKGPSAMAVAGSKAPRDASEPSQPLSLPPKSRLGIPPSPFQRQDSKQAIKNPATSTGPRVIGSSPMTPRHCKPAAGPETILISSSPVEPSPMSVSPAMARPGPRTGPPPVLSGPGVGSSPRGLSRGRSAQTPKKPKTTTCRPLCSGLKQSSMDAFVSLGAKPSASAHPQDSGADRQGGKTATDDRLDDSDDSGLESLSVLLSQAQQSPSKRRRQAPAVRWSDVSVIDLTEGN